jgi:glucokinase
MGKKYTIGIDIGGTSIKLGLFDNDGQLLSRDKIPTLTGNQGSSILPSVVRQTGILLESASIDIDAVASIGLGVPGTTDDKTGIALLAPNIFWKNVEVRKFIQGHYNVPVHLAQDSRAAAWGELLRGAGKGMNQIACITLGTGIGCGLIIDGRIFHGSMNTAGEFGHQIVEDDGPACNCGRNGCLEMFAGGRAILAKTLSIPGITSLTGRKTDEIEVLDLFLLASKKNTRAMAVVNEVVTYLGIGMVNLINLTSPQLIVISGGISNAPDDLLLDPLVKFVRERAYAGIADKVKIVKSTLGDDAPLIGASLLHLA